MDAPIHIELIKSHQGYLVLADGEVVHDLTPDEALWQVACLLMNKKGYWRPTPQLPASAKGD